MKRFVRITSSHVTHQAVVESGKLDEVHANKLDKTERVAKERLHAKAVEQAEIERLEREH